VPAASPSRVLIVAHQTADSRELREAVARRADQGPCTFTLLVPSRPEGPWHSGDHGDLRTAAAEERLEMALPVLSAAAGEAIVGGVGGPEPLAAVQDTLSLPGFD